jgi:hypothetical protein
MLQNRIPSNVCLVKSEESWVSLRSACVLLKNGERQELEGAVAAFLSKGGTIKRVRSSSSGRIGKSSANLKIDSWRQYPTGDK